MFLATAESCTGGLVSALCTNVPGSSRWFRGGVVSYDNAVKTRLLGVGAGLLACNGAVSGPVVEAMARGAITALDAQAALAVSGIAGPGGGSTDKPVGTVWIAAAFLLPGDTGLPEVRSFCRFFTGSRNDIRFGAALAALGAVCNGLDDSGMI